MAAHGPIYIVGSGPMIGSHVARLFATHAFNEVVLFARSASKLSDDASFVKSSAPSASVHTYTADVTDHASLATALDQAVAEVGVPEVVVYNAARIKHSVVGQYAATDIVEDFKVPNLGLYITASVLLPHLQALAKDNPDAHPSLFVTSGSIIHGPRAEVFSLSMAKTAQASLAKVLAEDNKDVVHVALITVSGVVSPEEKENNPTNIASKFWELYEQKKGDWKFEIRCGW